MGPQNNRTGTKIYFRKYIQCGSVALFMISGFDYHVLCHVRDSFFFHFAMSEPKIYIPSMYNKTSSGRLPFFLLVESIFGPIKMLACPPSINKNKRSDEYFCHNRLKELTCRHRLHTLAATFCL